jgi:hypothetical protein
MIVKFVVGSNTFVLHQDHAYTCDEVTRKLRELNERPFLYISYMSNENKPIFVFPVIRIYIDGDLIRKSRHVDHLQEDIEDVVSLHNTQVFESGNDNMETVTETCVFELQEATNVKQKRIQGLLLDMMTSRNAVVDDKKFKRNSGHMTSRPKRLPRFKSMSMYRTNDYDETFDDDESGSDAFHDLGMSDLALSELSD